MTIVVKDPMIGTFQWELPDSLSPMFDKSAPRGSIAGDLSLSTELLAAIQAEALRDLRTLVHHYLLLLVGTMHLGPVAGEGFSMLNDTLEVCTGALKELCGSPQSE